MSQIKRVFIDTDAGADDLLAIMLILAQPKIKVEGIVVSFGNYDVNTAVKRVTNLLKYLKKDIPLYTGATKPLKKTHTSAAFIHGLSLVSTFDILPIRPKPKDLFEYFIHLNHSVIYICLGPMTNLALLLHHKHHTKIAKVLALGGSFEGSGNISPLAEANFYHDPDSVEKVLMSTLKVTIFPLESVEDVQITTKQLTKLKDSKFINKFISHYVEFYQSLGRSYLIKKDDVKHVKKFRGGVLYDVVLIAWLIQPSLGKSRKLRVVLDFLHTIRGYIFSLDRESHYSTVKKQATVTIVSKINKNLFWSLFFKLLGSEQRTVEIK